ncbi:precorrin-3B synthase [Methylobacterium organophilum]|uniref:precorrin-3B synthase n=1 Tax=Methylobacterium organophilum TaxID=410 RepID=UPI001F130691|nr:precorrin-3B synthase [Methylobacterium organophilum]UMY19805.1 precorrin-3B synthase [Methylobacterium organophilum]
MSGRRILPEGARRGWCPSLARPMPTGDGLLVRVHPPLGRLTPGQARAVAEGARRHGNGNIDITARGNLQIRGVTPESGSALACLLDGAGLGDVRDDGGPQRLTLTSPLAGHDASERIDVPALARAIEAVGLTINPLPAKTLVAIEGGGRFGLAGLEADFTLRATRPGFAALGCAAPEGLAWTREQPAIQMPGLLGLALCVFAESGARRMRDLDDDARARVIAAAGGAGPAPDDAAEPPPQPGRAFLSRSRSAVVVEAPFGRCDAAGFERLADLAGTAELRLSPSRGVCLVTSAAQAAGLLAALAEAGFVTRADDPRRAVAACPGAPACASGTTPVPDHAARLAGAFADFATGGLTAHVSGCAKGCAHPGPADLTLVGREGAYDIVLGGRPDAEPAIRLTFEAALDRVRRAQTGGVSAPGATASAALRQAFQDDGT